MQVVVKWFNVEEYSEQVTGAYEYGITIYDASYVAPANHLDCLLYTADSKLLEKVRSTNIKSIAEV